MSIIIPAEPESVSLSEVYGNRVPTYHDMQAIADLMRYGGSHLPDETVAIFGRVISTYVCQFRGARTEGS